MSAPSPSIDRVVASFRRRLEHYDQAHDLPDDAAERFGRSAADFVAARELFRGELADRIGPVFDAKAVAIYLAPPGHPLTTEAVRQKAKRHDLVAFQSDDRQWLFPQWQFDTAAGELVPHAEVIDLWKQLPHDRWMSRANLAVWMNARLRSLAATPVEHVRGHGPAGPVLQRAVSRLRARAAGAGI